MRIIVIGGPKRGKTTLATHLARTMQLRHLCTDPQRLCPPTVIGTPDALPFDGPQGVGAFVARAWLELPNTIVEGCKAIHAIRYWLEWNGDKFKLPADKVIYPDKVLDTYTKVGQSRLDTQVQNIVDDLHRHLRDKLEVWHAYPDGWRQRDPQS